MSRSPSQPSEHCSNADHHSIEDAPLQHMRDELWLEKYCSDLGRRLNQCVTIAVRSAERLSEQSVELAIEHPLFQLIVNDLTMVLGANVAAFAQPAKTEQTASSAPTFTICCTSAPDVVWDEPHPLHLGRVLSLPDLYRFHEQAQAWAVPQLTDENQTQETIDSAVWLIVIPLQPLQPLHQRLIMRMVQECATARRWLHGLHTSRQRSQRLETRIRELEQANHLKSEFLANTSHEIRTPLNSILGFAQLLLLGYDVNRPTHRDYLNMILSSGQHLLALINDILDLSKVEANQLDLERSMINVADLCHSLITLMSEKAVSKGIQLHLDIDMAGEICWADPLRLKQMLFNLLSNAIKFTVEGSVGLRVQVADNFLHFIVWDTGVGINQEQQTRLFQPYAQLDPTYEPEGTGLGLALTQKLALLHGGWVEVRSQLHQGSEFTLALPLPPADLAHTATPRSVMAAPSPSFSTIRAKKRPAPVQAPILLVENDIPTGKLVLGFLGELGYEVFWVKYARDLWAALRITQPTLILMDHRLSDGEGLELLRQLRSHPHYSTIPVVVETAMAMVGDRERCLEAGATEYIAKPINLASLVEIVEHYCTET